MNAQVAVGLAVLLFLLGANAVAAQTKITLLYNPVSDMAGAFVAKDQGFFEKHGLDVDLTLSPNAGAVPGALVSNTVQIGTTVPPLFLQADDQGLDLVVVAGTDLTDPNAPILSGILVREGSNIEQSPDLVGKKVAVAVFGSTLDVLTRRWLRSHGVDYHQINWVEIQFQQMQDSLKAGLVDAVVVPYPFYKRIVDAKIGHPIGGGRLNTESIMPALYLSTRSWAAQHTDVIGAFRSALDDAAAFFDQPANQAAVLGSVAKWTKLPPQAVTPESLPARLKVHAQPDDLAFWIDAVQEQGLIKKKPDAVSLIAP
jgi:NitT/TauT family transport system substrate-binding protein